MHSQKTQSSSVHKVTLTQRQTTHVLCCDTRYCSGSGTDRKWRRSMHVRTEDWCNEISFLGADRVSRLHFETSSSSSNNWRPPRQSVPRDGSCKSPRSGSSCSSVSPHSHRPSHLSTLVPDGPPSFPYQCQRVSHGKGRTGT